MKQVYITTNGCPENRVDSAGMQEFMKANGWSVTNAVSEADLILFNACGLTLNAEEFSLNIIRQFKARQKPGSRLIVCGCLPRINRQRVREIYDDVTFGSDEISPLADLIQAPHPSTSPAANYLAASCDITPGVWGKLKLMKFCFHPCVLLTRFYMREYRKFWDRINILGPQTFYIKVSTGCLSSCSYCAVKLSRGGLRSKPIERVLEEFRRGLAQGFTTFALIGSDVGCYGRDQQTTLTQLLRKMVAVPGNYELRIRNFHPRFLIEMLPEFVDVCRSGKITYLCPAAQSGNNRVLELMRRDYRIEDLRHALNTLKQECPQVKVRTQLIAGFPTETEAEFEDTLRLIDDVDFDFIELYDFSPRAGTKAAQLDGRLPYRVIAKRYYRLLRKVLAHLQQKHPLTAEPAARKEPALAGAPLAKAGA